MNQEQRRLWEAIARDQADVETVKALLADEVDPEFFEQNTTPLNVAAYRGHIEVVKKLLDSKKINLNNPLSYRTPLIDAIEGKNIEVVQILLESEDPKVDVNFVTKRGESALNRAIQGGNSNRQIIEMLLKAGAICNDKDFEQLIKNKNIDLAKLILTYVANPRWSTMVEQLEPPSHSKSLGLEKPVITIPEEEKPLYLGKLNLYLIDRNLSGSSTHQLLLKDEDLRKYQKLATNKSPNQAIKAILWDLVNGGNPFTRLFRAYSGLVRECLQENPLLSGKELIQKIIDRLTIEVKINKKEFKETSELAKALGFIIGELEKGKWELKHEISPNAEEMINEKKVGADRSFGL